MTRKHFEAIAKILRENNARYPNTPGIASTTEDLAEYFATINPRFDFALFIQEATRETEDF